MAKVCSIQCLLAGQSLGREHSVAKLMDDSCGSGETTCKPGVSPIVHEVNVKGLVSAEDMQVPHSELAMHVGAAGKPIIAWYMKSGNYANIVYETEEGCGYTHGLPGEVLSPKLQKLTTEMFG